MVSMQPKVLTKLHLVPLNKTTFRSGLRRIQTYIEQIELIYHIESINFFQ